MSHFCVYVFSNEDGRSVEDILAPFDENITFPPYVKLTKQQAIEKVRKEIDDYRYHGCYAKYIKDPDAYREEHKDRKDHLNYVEKEFPQRFFWTDEQCYEEEAKWYDKEMIDKNGNLLSTYNPNAKWDWWSEGGRWSKMLITKTGEHVDTAYANEIDWEKTGHPFAFVTPDVNQKDAWHERGEMGWWAIVTDEKEEDVWKKEFFDYVKDLPDDMVVTLIDCHI